MECFEELRVEENIKAIEMSVMMAVDFLRSEILCATTKLTANGGGNTFFISRIEDISRPGIAKSIGSGQARVRRFGSQDLGTAGGDPGGKTTWKFV